MPIVRKIISFGRSSKGVILPKGWLEYFEREAGCEIEEVTIEVNHELRITPILKEGEKT